MLAGLAACTPAVVSRADVGGAPTPQHMFVVSRPGDPAVPAEWPALQSAVATSLQACGITAEFSPGAVPVPPDELDRRIRSGDLSRRYDTVLRLEPAVIQVGAPDPFGTVVADGARYEAVLTEVPSGRMLFQGLVWLRKPFLFTRPGSNGATAGRALVRQMARDGVLRTCPA